MRCRSRRRPTCLMRPRRRQGCTPAVHDGHTAMLLGAARYLAETRNFAGDAVVIFQPAEEGGAGAAANAEGRPDGALRHRPGLRHAQRPRPSGRLVCNPGPVRSWPRPMQSISGLKGWAATPRVPAHMHRYRPGRGATDHIAAVDRIAYRRSARFSGSFRFANFHAGNARNVIPQVAELKGTVRTLTPGVRELVEKRGARGRCRCGADDGHENRPDVRARLSGRGQPRIANGVRHAGGEGDCRQWQRS